MDQWLDDVEAGEVAEAMPDPDDDRRLV